MTRSEALGTAAPLGDHRLFIQDDIQDQLALDWLNLPNLYAFPEQSERFDSLAKLTH